jgi:hypothetical protein
MRRLRLIEAAGAVQDREAEKSMTEASLTVGARVRLAAADFQTLLDALAGRGYRVMGPTLEDGQLIYGEIARAVAPPGPRSGRGPFAWAAAGSTASAG